MTSLWRLEKSNVSYERCSSVITQIIVKFHRNIASKFHHIINTSGRKWLIGDTTQRIKNSHKTSGILADNINRKCKLDTRDLQNGKLNLTFPKKAHGRKHPFEVGNCRYNVRYIPNTWNVYLLTRGMKWNIEQHNNAHATTGLTAFDGGSNLL